MTPDNVVPIHNTTTTEGSSDLGAILASGSGPHACTRCATEYTVRTWHVVWPADSDLAVCAACALDDRALRPWALRSIAADAIDRALTEAPSRADRRTLAHALISDVSWFANWREPDEPDEPIEWIELEQPVGAPAEAVVPGPANGPTAYSELVLGGEPVSLRRAALRAGKMLDRHFASDDALLDTLEHAYGNGTDEELAGAVLALVNAAEAVA